MGDALRPSVQQNAGGHERSPAAPGDAETLRRRLTLATVSLGGLLTVLLAGHWWVTLPRTPEELFRARCSKCHELRIARVCEFDVRLRPAIVDTMRRMHGADEVIDDEEAAVIRRYLEETLKCP